MFKNYDMVPLPHGNGRTDVIFCFFTIKFRPHVIGQEYPVHHGIDENEQKKGRSENRAHDNDHKQHGQAGPDFDQALKNKIKYTAKITHGTADQNADEVNTYLKGECEQ